MRRITLLVVVLVATLFVGCATSHSPEQNQAYQSHDFTRIWGTSANNLFVVGTGGVILHYNGTGWTETIINSSESFSGVEADTANAFTAIVGLSPVEVYAATFDKRLYHYNGESWRLERGKPIYGRLKTAAAYGDAVLFGSHLGDFVTYDNKTWDVTISSQSINGFNSIIVEGKRVLAGRDKGGIHELRSSGWERLTPEETEIVWGVCIMGEQIFAATDTGLKVLDNDELVFVASDTPMPHLRHVWTTGKMLYAVGAQGEIFSFDGKKATRM